MKIAQLFIYKWRLHNYSLTFEDCTIYVSQIIFPSDPSPLFLFPLQVLLSSLTHPRCNTDQWLSDIEPLVRRNRCCWVHEKYQICSAPLTVQPLLPPIPSQLLSPVTCPAQKIASDGQTLNFPVFERINLHFSPSFTFIPFNILVPPHCCSDELDLIHVQGAFF